MKINFISYINSAPANNKNPHKKEILKKFAQGVAAFGDNSLSYEGHTPLPCDVGFIQGWVHEKSGNSSHLLLRKKVINEQKKTNKNVLVVDSNLFNYKDKNKTKKYSRYSFDGVFPTTGQYFNSIVDPLRWKKISQEIGITLKDWKTTGEYILICTQRNGGWSMGSLDVPTWLNQTIEEIRKYSDRKIVVRPHPGDGSALSYLKNNDSRYKLSSNEYIWQDFENAKAVITYNSSPGVAGAIEGVPIFVTDPNPRISQAYEVCNTLLSRLENPEYPERQQWVEKLCMSHWSVEEISTGMAWCHMRNFINR